MLEAVRFHARRDFEPVAQRVGVDKRRAHRGVLAHLQVRLAPPHFGAIGAAKHGDVDRGTGHVGADFGNIGDEDDGPAGHKFRAGRDTSAFPEALLQNRGEEIGPPAQLPLHFQRAKGVFDSQDPAALVHLAANRDELLHEALANEEDPVEFSRDL